MLSPRTRETHRLYILRRRRERRAACVSLLGGQCIRCGRTDDLEFAHKIDRRHTGDRKLHDCLLWAWDRLVEELKKVELLCPACHMIADERIEPADYNDYVDVTSVTNIVGNEDIPF